MENHQTSNVTLNPFRHNIINIALKSDKDGGSGDRIDKDGAKSVDAAICHKPKTDEGLGKLSSKKSVTRKIQMLALYYQRRKIRK